MPPFARRRIEVPPPTGAEWIVRGSDTITSTASSCGCEKRKMAETGRKQVQARTRTTARDDSKGRCRRVMELRTELSIMNCSS
jgi:hypothetical protein